jgi:tetratricopeptide (TPR) repeat protein
VLGTRFTVAALRQLVDTTDGVLEEPIRAGLWSASGEDLWFRHALIRDGVYASLTRLRRRQLHLDAATVCGDEPVDRARHLDRAEDPSAASAYREAARARRATLEYDEALSLAERAYALESDDSAYESQMLRGALLREMGRPREALDAFRAAATATDSDTERCSAWIREGEALRATSSLQPALDVLARAQAVATDALERLQIHYHLASIHFARADGAESMTHARGALELAATVGELARSVRWEMSSGDSAACLVQRGCSSAAWSRPSWVASRVSPYRTG